MEQESVRLPASRKVQLAAYVQEVGHVTVAALAAKFHVSVDTIRRDLDQLDAEGVLIRAHGGALSLSATPRSDTALNIRTRLQPGPKDAMGKIAASLVEDGSVLIINGGSSALAVVRHLHGSRELIIATNNLQIPAEIDPDICRDLYLLGGIVRLSAQVTIGPVSFQSEIDKQDLDIKANLAIIGVGAVEAENGFSTSNLSEAITMREMAKRADKVVILADSTKIGRRLFTRIGGLELADILITDKEVDAKLKQACELAGVQVLTPNNSK